MRISAVVGTRTVLWAGVWHLGEHVLESELMVWELVNGSCQPEEKVDITEKGCFLKEGIVCPRFFF